MFSLAVVLCKEQLTGAMEGMGRWVRSDPLDVVANEVSVCRLHCDSDPTFTFAVEVHPDRTHVQSDKPQPR